VDVARLVEETETALQRLVELGPERLDQFDPALIPTIAVSREK
jgi:hypothetical protein